MLGTREGILPAALDARKHKAWIGVRKQGMDGSVFKNIGHGSVIEKTEGMDGSAFKNTRHGSVFRTRRACMHL
jgi:hypothetical protein